MNLYGGVVTPAGDEKYDIHRMRRRWFAALALLVLSACASASHRRPTLIVTIAVDQLRADLLDRYDSVFTGGFRRLRDRGLRFPNTYVNHTPTTSFPGHTTIATGCNPAKHGIVAGGWPEYLGDGKFRGIEPAANSRIVSGAGSVLDLNGAKPAYVLHPTTGGQEVAVWSDGSGAYVDAAGSSTAGNNAIIFRTASAANSYVPAEAMRIGNNGYVGIGSQPDTTNRLTVNGNLNVTGNITGATVVGAVYQDVAEWVPSSESLQPGTVVVLDTAAPNHVIASHSAYDTSVAGVISANPGVILGKGGAAEAKVATLGRVRVKVDASKHPVHVGDLLVTSDTPGTAMVSVPVDIGGIKMHRPGTLIGKALEPLERGRGEILVLLSMQ